MEIKCPYCGGTTFNRISYGKSFGAFDFPINSDIYICQNCGKEVGGWNNGEFKYFDKGNKL